MSLPLIIAIGLSLNPDSCATASGPTPPQFEQLAALRTMQDVVGISQLANGAKAPSNLILPKLLNRRQTLDFMRVHYPSTKKRRPADSRPIAWVCVDRHGRVARSILLSPTGDAAFDSLSLNVFTVAAFTPAQSGSDTLEVWFPLPAAVPLKDELEAALAADGFDRSTTPSQTPFTEAPVLQNRSRIEAAILRVIHNVNPQAVQRNEILYRSQQIGGTTIMWIFIDVAGNVTNSVIKKTSGNTDLDLSAQQIVSTMRFFPAKLDGKPVDVWIEVPIAFRSR
jgi:TonB family protein